MSKIEDIKKNFDKLHKTNKSYHQIENEQYLMKIDNELFCCNSADSENCILYGKLEVADPDFIDKAAEVLEKEAKDVQRYLDGKEEDDASFIPGPEPDSDDKDPSDHSADHIPD